MKPAPFEYHAPESVEEALGLLAEHGDAAKLLAGGQSLIPTMNFRLAQPAILIDLGRVSELAYIRPGGSVSGGSVSLAIGAMTRQRQVEQSAVVAQHAPLVHMTMPHVAHPQIRNQGTFGGSIAHADPSAELPAVILALGAKCRLRSSRARRTVAAGDFFNGLFSTVMEPDEMLVEVSLPARAPRTFHAFHEVARRHGDYAMAGVAVSLTLDEAGRCAAARIVLLSVGEGPVEAAEARSILLGEPLDEKIIARAARAAGQKDIDPPQDIHASKPYRRHLAEVVTRRALLQALAEPDPEHRPIP